MIKCHLLLLLLVISMKSFSEDIYIIKNHIDIVNNKGNFLLCTNSDGDGVNAGVFAIEDNKPKLLLSTYIENEKISTFTNTITSLLTQLYDSYGIKIKYACFSGPGVPSNNQDYLENVRLPYVIDAKQIVTQNNLTVALVVNHFLAISYGINLLENNKNTILHDAQAQDHGRRIIVGAGAGGLGAVLSTWDEQQQSYTNVKTEAGMGNFPPLDAFELELVEHMKKIRNSNSIPWVFCVSQQGIQHTYQILQDMNYQGCATDKKYPNAMTILADAGNDACCAKTAELFYKFYARFVYNFVCKTLPFGGIYLVGETVTHNPEMLTKFFLPEYFNCVESKRPLLQCIPIYIIKDNELLRLYGMAYYFLLEKKELWRDNSSYYF